MGIWSTGNDDVGLIQSTKAPWRAKCDPKAKMLDLQSFLRKGVSLGHVGRNQNLKDPKDLLRKGEMFAFGGSIQTPKNLSSHRCKSIIRTWRFRVFF